MTDEGARARIRARRVLQCGGVTGDLTQIRPLQGRVADTSRCEKGYCLMDESVTYEVNDVVATITLNRRHERNTINLEVCDAVYAAVQQAESDPAVRVMVLTGSGAVFCAGADLKAIAAGQGPDIADHRGGFGGFVRVARTKPVIAAVNGHALAGGLELVLAADLAIASTQALFGVPEVTVGLIAGGGGAIRLPVDLPPKIGMQMLLTGKPITAANALLHGLVNELAEHEDVLPAAHRLAREICAAAPTAVAATLRVARTSMSLRDEANAWCISDDTLARIFETPNAVEGIAAFTNKRPPHWTV